MFCLYNVYICRYMNTTYYIYTRIQKERGLREKRRERYVQLTGSLVFMDPLQPYLLTPRTSSFVRPDYLSPEIIRS